MATVVIMWEGKEAFLMDLRLASKIVNFKEPLWYGGYDTGLILTDNPDDTTAICLRYGVKGVEKLEKELYSSDLRITDNWLRDHYAIYKRCRDKYVAEDREVLKTIAEENGIKI
jgi:hypothetical protein